MYDIAYNFLRITDTYNNSAYLWKEHLLEFTFLWKHFLIMQFLSLYAWSCYNWRFICLGPAIRKRESLKILCSLLFLFHLSSSRFYSHLISPNLLPLYFCVTGVLKPINLSSINFPTSFLPWCLLHPFHTYSLKPPSLFSYFFVYMSWFLVVDFILVINKKYTHPQHIYTYIYM